MNRRNFLSGLFLGGLGLAAGAGAAHAQRFPYDPYDRYDRYGRPDRWDYRRYTYFRGRDRDEIRRREALRFRMFDLAERIRMAEREGLISRRRANDLYDDLDDVRDFLRNDRNLTRSEFERRRDDLDDIADDLRDSYRRRGGRFRTDPWFDRYQDRYRRDGRYYRW